MDRDDTLIVRLPSAVKEAVRKAAEADHGRSMSGMVVRILSEWLTTNGHHLHVESRPKKGRK
jgi:hypothetical protein